MKYPAVSEDLVSVKEFRSSLATCFKRVEETGRPIVITQHGRAAAVVVSPRAMDEMVEEARLLRALVRAIRDLADEDSERSDEARDQLRAVASTVEATQRAEDLELRRSLLAEVKGFIPSADITGRDHDEVLYGRR